MIILHSNLLFSEMDYLPLLLVALQIYKTAVEGDFVDATVRLTNSMTLECIYPEGNNISQMSWFKRNKRVKDKIAVFKPSYDAYIEEKYKGRVSFVSSAPKDRSLTLIKTTPADTGLYFCSVHAFPDGIWEKVIQVVQSDGFEIPVQPTHHVATKPGENVTLTCHIGSSVQLVKWERIKTDQRDTIVVCNLSSTLKIYGSDYEERIAVDCGRHANSTIVLQNVTASDSGIYHCHRYSTATRGNKSDVINLTVISATLDHEKHILLIAGAAAASILLLLIILIIIAVRVHRRKKKKRRIMMALSKALYSTQTRLSNSYGGADCHGTRTRSREEEAVSSRQTEEIYVNYRNISRKPKTYA
uniref:CD226 molecule n=1 Tax=Sphenodon punctatus TaxID=8508 RepID=A0A8D0H0W3_SPHPU